MQDKRAVDGVAGDRGAGRRERIDRVVLNHDRSIGSLLCLDLRLTDPDLTSGVDRGILSRDDQAVLVVHVHDDTGMLRVEVRNLCPIVPPGRSAEH